MRPASRDRSASERSRPRPGGEPASSWVWPVRGRQCRRSRRPSSRQRRRRMVEWTGEEPSGQSGEQSADREGHEDAGGRGEELRACVRRRREPRWPVPRPGANGRVAFRREDHEGHRSEKDGEKHDEWKRQRMRHIASEQSHEEGARGQPTDVRDRRHDASSGGRHASGASSRSAMYAVAVPRPRQERGR